MTTLHKFLTFNKHCPICNNPLTLYMQWIDSNLFIANEQSPGIFHFINYQLMEIDNDEETKSIILMDYGDKFDISFSHPSLFNEAKKYQIYFYFLCKQEGFRSRNLKDYEINLAKGCYYRSTPLMEFKKEEIWKLDYTIAEFSDLVNKDECFCLKSRKDNTDKIYMLSRDMEIQNTKVFYFTITDEQRVNANFKPNIFRKELPLIPRPSLNNQRKLLDKINLWITVS